MKRPIKARPGANRPASGAAAGRRRGWRGRVLRRRVAGICWSAEPGLRCFAPVLRLEYQSPGPGGDGTARWLRPSMAQAHSSMTSEANVAVALPHDVGLPIEDAERIRRTG